MAPRNKIYNFKDLKEYTKHVIKGGADIVRQAHQSAKDKVKTPSLLAEIESLKSEIKGLKALRHAMYEEGSQAGKRALRLYWDNCNLEKYRDHANGILYEWIPRSEHDIMSRQYEKLKLDFAALSSSSSAMQQEWAEFINNYDVKSAQ